MEEEREEDRSDPASATGGVIGGLALAFSLWPWVLYLRSAWAGFDPNEVGSEVTDYQLLKLFFGIWLSLWLAGLAIVLVSMGDRTNRSILQLAGLTSVMLAASGLAYFLGRA
ncbi:hypothetical protein [Saccharopolyspora tripterygii]